MKASEQGGASALQICRACPVFTLLDMLYTLRYLFPVII